MAHADKKPVEDVETITRLGIVVNELNAAQKQELQVSGGLLVESVKGAIARTAGLRQGDVLLAIGNMSLRSAEQLNELLTPIPNGHNIALLVRRGDSASYVAIRLGEK